MKYDLQYFSSQQKDNLIKNVFKQENKSNKAYKAKRKKQSKVNDKKKSMGFTGVSAGEKKIADYLTDLSINYIREYPVPEISKNKSLPLRFDFYLPEHSMCIEFDGAQHYKYKKNGWHDTLDAFLHAKNNDYLKNDYCREKGFDLIRISYAEIGKVNSILSPYLI